MKNLFRVQRYHQTENGVCISGPRFVLGGRQWVVPRSHCLFHSLRIDDIPIGDVQEALVLKILEWSPFQETGQYIAFMNKYALIWIWDKILQQHEASQYGAKTAIAVPETVLRQPVTVEGATLVLHENGCEGQWWRDGVLLASHWWASPPEEKIWLQFLLRNDLPQSVMPSVTDLGALLTVPWGGRGRIDVATWIKSNEYLLVKCIVLLISLYAVWLAGDAFHTSREIHRTRDAIRVRDQEVEPILAARLQALDYQNRVKLVDQLSPFPSLIEMGHAVLSLLPEKVEVRKWSFLQGKISILVSGGVVDTQELVRQLEGSGFFDQVSVQHGKAEGQVEIDMIAKKKGAH